MREIRSENLKGVAICGANFKLSSIGTPVPSLFWTFVFSPKWIAISAENRGVLDSHSLTKVAIPVRFAAVSHAWESQVVEQDSATQPAGHTPLSHLHAVNPAEASVFFATGHSDSSPKTYQEGQRPQLNATKIVLIFDAASMLASPRIVSRP